MEYGLFSILILLAIILQRSLSDVIPTVTLMGNDRFQVGDILVLTCKVDVDVDLLSVSFFKGIKATVWINDPASCTFFNQIHQDPSRYNTTCNPSKTSFTLTKYALNPSDDKTVWTCQMISNTGGTGPCVGASNPCISGSVTLKQYVTTSAPPTITTSAPPTNDNNIGNIVGGSVGGTVGVFVVASAAVGCWYKTRNNDDTRTSVGGAAFVVVVAGAVGCWNKKKKNKKTAEGKDYEAQNDGDKNGQQKEGATSETGKSESKQSPAICIGTHKKTSDRTRPSPPVAEVTEDITKQCQRPLPPLNRYIKDPNKRPLTANFDDEHGLPIKPPQDRRLPPLLHGLQLPL